MSPPQMMIYFAFFAILLTDLLISLVLLCHAVINYIAIYDVVTSILFVYI